MSALSRETDAYDIGGTGRHEIGAAHYLVEWHERQPGHTCSAACDDRGLEDCFTCRARAFPNRGLALAFARRTTSVWEVRIARETFEPAGYDGGRLGSWEREGEYEEVDA